MIKQRHHQLNNMKANKALVILCSPDEIYLQSKIIEKVHKLRSFVPVLELREGQFLVPIPPLCTHLGNVIFRRHVQVRGVERS